MFKNYFFIILVTWNALFGNTLKSSSIKILGAAKQVSGSSYLIETEQTQFLVDCGFFYPENQSEDYDKDKEHTEYLNIQLPVSPQSISAIVITHAHLDHIGKIPLLVKRGFTGKIISTELSKKLSLIMMEMILKGTNMGEEMFVKSTKSQVIHSMKSCSWVKKIKSPVSIKSNRGEFFDRGLRLCSVCIETEVEQISSLFETYPYNKKIYLSKEDFVEFYNAKHIPGSSSILVSLESDKNRIFFSGDVGSGLDNILEGKPETPDNIDYIFMESTYGGNTRVISIDPFLEFFSDINDALSEDKIVWIPCFVLDRTQKVLNSIKTGQERGLLPSNIDLKIVSSTAKKVNRVYDKHYQYKPKYVDESLTMSPEKLEKHLTGPMILFTPSYLDDLDFFHPIMKKLFESHDTFIALVGYQDPRSIGGILKNIIKGSNVKLGNMGIKVEANASYYGGIFSGHIDSKGILGYLKSINIKETVFLVHGTNSSLIDLQNQLIKNVNNKVLIPNKGQKFSIK